MSNKAWLLVKAPHGLYWVKERSLVLGGSADCDYQITHRDDQLRLQLNLTEDGAILERLGSRYPVVLNQEKVDTQITLPKAFDLSIQVGERQYERLECVCLLDEFIKSQPQNHSKDQAYRDDLIHPEDCLKLQLQRLDEITKKVNSLYALSRGEILWNLDEHHYQRNGVRLEIHDNELWVSSDDERLQVNGKGVHVSQVYVGDQLMIDDEVFQVIGQSDLRRVLPPSSLVQEKKHILKESTTQFDYLQASEDYEKSIEQDELELFRSRLQNWLAWKPVEPLFGEQEEDVFEQRNQDAIHEGADTSLQPSRALQSMANVRHATQYSNSETALDQRFLEDQNFHESFRKELLMSQKQNKPKKFTLIHKVALGSVLFLTGTLFAVVMLGS